MNAYDYIALGAGATLGLVGLVAGLVGLRVARKVEGALTEVGRRAPVADPAHTRPADRVACRRELATSLGQVADELTAGGNLIAVLHAEASRLAAGTFPPPSRRPPGGG